MPRPVEDRSDVGGAAQFNNIGPVPLPAALVPLPAALPQSAGRSRARTDWVMVCSSPLMAMAVIHSANRRKLGRVKAQAKADSRACQIDQSRLA